MSTEIFKPLGGVVSNLPSDINLKGELLILYVLGFLERTPLCGMGIYDSKSVFFYPHGEKVHIFDVNPEWNSTIKSEHERYRRESGYNKDFGPTYIAGFYFTPEKEYNLFKYSFRNQDIEVSYLGHITKKQVHNFQQQDKISPAYHKWFDDVSKV